MENINKKTRGKNNHYMNPTIEKLMRINGMCEKLEKMMVMEMVDEILAKLDFLENNFYSGGYENKLELYREETLNSKQISIMS